MNCAATLRSSGPGFVQIGSKQLHGALVHEHRRVHVGGVNGVDANRVLPEFDGEGTHQTDDAVLGGDVVAGVWIGLEAADGAGQDDRPALPCDIKCGTAALTVFQTPEGSRRSCPPVGFTGPSRVWPPLPIPALAQMMSNRPSCSTPLSTAALTAS